MILSITGGGSTSFDRVTKSRNLARARLEDVFSRSPGLVPLAMPVFLCWERLLRLVAQESVGLFQSKGFSRLADEVDDLLDLFAVTLLHTINLPIIRHDRAPSSLVRKQRLRRSDVSRGTYIRGLDTLIAF
ncbi:hypothetical protein [Bradyrhizobium sp. USDA 4452]